MSSNYYIKDLSYKDLAYIKKTLFDDSSISARDINHFGKTSLDELIGLKNVKLTVKKIKAYIEMHKNSKKPVNTHMCFLGNPGTGKTEVARMIANIFYDAKVLPSNRIVEVSRRDLVGKYVGETPYLTNSVVDEAMGGVLFVDEAYSLIPKEDGGFDYGHEALATLLKRMEDDRGKFCVIFAGYKNEMNKMLDVNPGLKSRFQFYIDFEDYSRDELKQIFELILERENLRASEEVIERMLCITDVKRTSPNFANAREVRNILEAVTMCQNLRIVEKGLPANNEILLEDVDKYINDEKIRIKRKEINNKPLSGLDQLNKLIGLNEVKTTVRKINAYIKKNTKTEDFGMHMCFLGNPGTGKTEVARILSRVLFEAKAIDSSKIIETDASGLISEYVGHTSKKTHELVQKAMGGVLFIDEAYALVNSKYGEEAIAALLKDMEDCRDKICVILAGYKNEMSTLLDKNPGFKSRIKFHIYFPDYTFEDLVLIADLFFKKKNYLIEEDLLKVVAKTIEAQKDMPNFANARTLRNLVDQIILNQNLRTENSDGDFTVTIDDIYDALKESDLKLDFSTVNEKEVGSAAFLESIYDSYEDFLSDEVDEDYIEQAVISISGKDDQSTGFIIDGDKGLCLTCAHCIVNEGKEQTARIIFNLGRRKIKSYSCFEVLKIDKTRDLALIKLKEENDYLYLPIEKEDYNMRPLISFITAGYPFGGETFSSISFSEGKTASVNFFQGNKVVFANMFGKPGSSGSPIIDAKTKKVIGLYTGGIKCDDNVINTFVPIDVIIDFIKR